jgi:hypothetical protein
VKGFDKGRHGDLVIPINWFRLAALVAALSLVGYIGYRIDRNAVERTNKAWQAKVQASEIRALRAEAERDDKAREIAEATRKEIASGLAQIKVENRLTLERIRPLLPDIDPECTLPDGVRDEIQAAIDRANAASR